MKQRLRRKDVDRIVVVSADIQPVRPDAAEPRKKTDGQEERRASGGVTRF